MTKEIKITEVPSIVTDTARVELNPKVTPVEKKEVAVLHIADRIPSEWRIEVVNEDTIRAVNNTSRNVFEGSIEEFNKILRG